MFRSEKLRRAVAGLPCQHCGREGCTQAAHRNESKGMGMKVSDALLAALPRKARVDAVIDLRDKLDRGDVWASDYQTLLGRVERSAA